MNERFRELVTRLEPKLQSLLAVPPVKIDTLPRTMPASGVYLFSEGAEHLYVGRRKRLRARLRYHASDQYFAASFAFMLARETTGFTQPTYTKRGSRAELQTNAKFRAAFRQARERIASMDVRFVDEPDPVGQALLEIYAAMALHTQYNKFETT